MIRYFILLTILYSPIYLIAQESAIIPFDSKKWNFSGENYKLIDESGASVLQLDGNVKAYLTDSDFVNGEISFEVKFSKRRTFLGCIFRMQDLENYEDFYMRPHQSGNPDATQYTPVFNDLSAWQLYHGEGYSAPVSYKFDEWIPVKMVINESEAEVYFFSENEPSFKIPQLHRPKEAGMVGLWGGNGMFRNFTYKKSTASEIKSNRGNDEIADKGTIMEWDIYNDTFDENQNDEFMKNLDDSKWTHMKTDHYGRLNISKKLKLAKTKNTAIVSIDIEADNDELRQIDFGFSDRVIVYVNGQPIYKGNNTFRTRDYRFLGSESIISFVNRPVIHKIGRAHV